MTQAMFRQRVRDITRGDLKGNVRCGTATLPQGSPDSGTTVQTTRSRCSMTRAIRTRRCRTQGCRAPLDSAPRARVRAELHSAVPMRPRTVEARLHRLAPPRHRYRLTGYRTVEWWRSRGVGTARDRRDPARMGLCRVPSEDRSSTRTRRRRRNPMPDEGR